MEHNLDSRRPIVRFWAAATLVLCCVGIWLRVLNAHTDLSSPAVDENEVVHQAVAFMGGEWRYYLLEYGPLPMYLLAAIYRLVAVWHGLDPLAYAARAFFDADEQYLIARLLWTATYATLSLLTYRVFAPRFGRGGAAVSALLLAFPVVDTLTRGNLRVDVPQGAFQIGALLALVKALDSKARWPWIVAGICAGCGIASKPMPGLLVLPCVAAAAWFAAEATPDTEQAQASAGRAFLGQMARTLRNPGPYLAALAMLGAAVLGNPTSLRFQRFIDAQIDAAHFYSGQHAPGGHLGVFEMSLPLGIPFLAAAGASVLAMPFVRDARARLVTLFPLIYLTAFWGRPARSYYLVAPAMGLCLVIGIAVGLGLRRLALPRAVRPWVEGILPFVLVAGLVADPSLTLDRRRRTLFSETLARNWIEHNIPSGTRLFHFGTYLGGPRLVASDAKSEAASADFFIYGRKHYDFYYRAFRKAYSDYVEQDRPRYKIEMVGPSPEPVASGHVKRWLSKSLVRHAVDKGQAYIILADIRGSGDVNDLGYSWLSEVTLVQQFGRIAIFKVPLPSAANEAAVAEGPRSDHP